MKKILITGQNSYIGNKFEEWVSQWPDEYQVTKISVRNDDWKNQNWSIYDVVLNVAGIAHQKITQENEKEYYKVNRDLAIGIANKAKYERVKHFIQTSTMSVFGEVCNMINLNTPCNPKTAYGKSKLEADLYLQKIQSNKFTVTIVRPPMVYGPKSPGNYKILSSFAKRTPIFPRVNNKRSMIYINNLSEFFRIIIEERYDGVKYPQNVQYVNITELVKQIAKVNNHNIIFVNSFGIPEILSNEITLFQKIFGNLTYQREMSNFDLEYNIKDFNGSILETERE